MAHICSPFTEYIAGMSLFCDRADAVHLNRDLMVLYGAILSNITKIGVRYPNRNIG